MDPDSAVKTWEFKSETDLYEFKKVCAWVGGEEAILTNDFLYPESKLPH